MTNPDILMYILLLFGQLVKPAVLIRSHDSVIGGLWRTVGHDTGLQTALLSVGEDGGG